MTDTKPIKRSKHLRPISRDHHHGLLLCWKIREGFKRGITEARIKRYTDWFWETHLEAHFAIEETYIFPILGNDHPLVKRALAEHRRLKRLFEQKEETWRSLNLIEEELDAHIRFEERVLFTAIQRAATEAQLKMVEKHHHDTSACDSAWTDAFWE